MRISMTISINYWQELKRFINHRSIGTIITRQEIMNLFLNYLPPTMTIGGYTFDKYRRYLTILEVLDHVGKGRYRIKEHIPNWYNSKNIQRMSFYKNIMRDPIEPCGIK